MQKSVSRGMDTSKTSAWPGEEEEIKKGNPYETADQRFLAALVALGAGGAGAGAGAEAAAVLAFLAGPLAAAPGADLFGGMAQWFEICVVQDLGMVPVTLWNVV